MLCLKSFNTLFTALYLLSFYLSVQNHAVLNSCLVLIPPKFLSHQVVPQELHNEGYKPPMRSINILCCNVELWPCAFKVGWTDYFSFAGDFWSCRLKSLLWIVIIFILALEFSQGVAWRHNVAVVKTSHWDLMLWCNAVFLVFLLFPWHWWVATEIKQLFYIVCLHQCVCVCVCIGYLLIDCIPLRLFVFALCLSLLVCEFQMTLLVFRYDSNLTQSLIRSYLLTCCE